MKTLLTQFSLPIILTFVNLILPINGNAFYPGTTATDHYLDSIHLCIAQAKTSKKIDLQLAELSYLMDKAYSQEKIKVSISDIDLIIKNGTPTQNAQYNLLKGINIQPSAENVAARLKAFRTGLNFIKNAGENDSAQMQVKAKLLLFIASTYGVAHRLDSVSYFVHLAEPIAERFGSARVRYHMYEILGATFTQSGENKLGLKYLLKAYKIGKQTNLGTQNSGVFAQLSAAYFNINKPDSAEYYLHEGIKYAHEKHNIKLASVIYGELSDQYLSKHDGVRALSMADSAIYYARDSGFQCYANIIKARALLMLKRNAEAHRVALRIIQQAKPIQYFEAIEAAYSVLSTVAVSESNYKEAYRYQKEYSNIHEFVDSLYNINEIKKLETAYESEKKDLSINKLENEKLIATKRNRGNFIIFLSLLILAAGIVLYLLYKHRKRIAEKLLLEKELTIEHERIKQLIEIQELKIIEARTLATTQQRKEFSFVLHDDIAGSLSGLMHYIDYADQNISTAPIEAKDTLKKIRSRMELLYHQARNLSHNLYPSTENDTANTFATEFEKFVHYLFSNSAIELFFKIHHPEQLNNLSLHKRIILYRVLQESTVNIFKYSAATKVEIDLFSDGEFAHLKIKDNGSGKNNSSSAPGIGHRNLNEQLSAVNGHLDIYADKEKGYTVEAELPV